MLEAFARESKKPLSDSVLMVWIGAVCVVHGFGRDSGPGRRVVRETVFRRSLEGVRPRVMCLAKGRVSFRLRPQHVAPVHGWSLPL